MTTTAITHDEVLAEKARRSFRAYCEFVHGTPNTAGKFIPLKLPPHFVFYEQTLTTQVPEEKATATAAPPQFW